jgi:GT2 family glycosyltransferase/glycosyltransferase involved in cell wall biosynthesis
MRIRSISGAIPGALRESNDAGRPLQMSLSPQKHATQAPSPLALRAVALANRLLEVEDATLSLRAELTHAKRERDNALGDRGEVGGGWFDIPRTRYPWPLVEQAALDDNALDKYDRRVDDIVLLEGRVGEAFLSRHALLASSPHYKSAIAELNATKPRLKLVPEMATETPDVSIIIPIYGQIGYVLNAIDSLFAHSARYSAEIILVDDASPDQNAALLPGLNAVRTHRQPRNGGFIDSCNSGGQLARGRFVTLLNSDTRVVPGWLDALVESFATFPRAGCVGSKLCYADGSLQEAGGIVWRDGTSWNYGRGDDPNRPQYSHARQVDYVSGCSIMVPTPLWRSLSGFDPYYAPAYCEDVDLCLRLQAAGHEVWFQPQSRVVHYEGKTCGTDTAAGVKAFQLINTRKIYLRWRERLEQHRPNAQAPYFERERHVRRRMLVVDTSAPTPKQDAGSVQTVLGLHVCRNTGYKTHFVAEDNWLFQPKHTTDLQKAGIECAYAPYDLGFGNYIRRYGHLFDVVMVYRMTVLERIIGDIRAYAPQAALLFHLADLHYLRRQREAELDGSEEGLAEAAVLKQRELALIKASDCTITHSPVEAAIIAEEVADAPVTVWPLMLNLYGTAAPFAARRDICFLGGYRHPPNVDAVQYFVKEIFPHIRKVDPQIRFLIAGANISRDVLALEQPGIDVLGQVEDLRDLFDRTRVFVCPLRFGAGVKGKIMSALSYGIPIVSTPIGVEGALLEAGRHVLVADTPTTFAQQTLRLYKDVKLWNALSTSGQQLIVEKFSLEMGRAKLSEAIALGHCHRLGLDGSSLAPASAKAGQ